MIVRLAPVAGPVCGFAGSCISKPDLVEHFKTAGLTSIDFWHEPHPELGIVFRDPWSLPCVVRKPAHQV
ncbi:MAG: hypothetical protein ACRD34_04680 [Bryobacteraceae bacterium]